MSDYRSPDDQSAARLKTWDVGPDGLLRVSDPSLDNDFLDELLDAALYGPRDKVEQVIAIGRVKGITAERLADVYVPAAARLMGDAWCVDNASFAEVTIGVSRLQLALRDLGPEWSGDCTAEADAPMILILVAQGVHHTLGASVLAGQLRRKGISSRLMLGVSPSEVATALKISSYNAVFISGACGDSLDSLGLIVKAAKTAGGRGIPVVLGGTVLQSAENVQELTGADFVTNDADEAIHLCNLKINLRQAHSTGT